METKKLKNVDIMELNEAYLKTMHWFFSFPNLPISLTDLAKETEVSKKTASQVVEILIQEKFLKKEVIGKSWRITCEPSHLYNLSRKVPYNLTLLYESGIISKIYEMVGNPRAIILFGSYRKGDDTEKSDIDIAVEILGNDELNIHKLGEFQKLGYRKNVPVNLHIFSRNKIDLNFFTNIANGIVLEGLLEVRP